MYIDVKIWRRGRGILNWRFAYYDVPRNKVKPSWYSSPGWYHVARKYVYRLTLDHDYPTKPLWLGRKKSGAGWECMEGLYEPLTIKAPGMHASNTIAYTGSPRRGAYRINKTRREIANDAIAT